MVVESINPEWKVQEKDCATGVDIHPEFRDLLKPLTKEEKKTLDRAKDHAFNADSELKHLWRTPARIPVSKRRGFLKSDLYSHHQENIEAELKFLAGNIFSDNSPPHIIRIRCKPPRGTRKKIIAQIADEHGLKLNQVDNLWQAYRRFERSQKTHQT